VWGQGKGNGRGREGEARRGTERVKEAGGMGEGGKMDGGEIERLEYSELRLDHSNKEYRSVVQ
jgi:hypothetical protein